MCAAGRTGRSLASPLELMVNRIDGQPDVRSKAGYLNPIYLQQVNIGGSGVRIVRRGEDGALAIIPPALRASVSIALFCTTRRRIPASASTDQGNRERRFAPPLRVKPCLQQVNIGDSGVRIVRRGEDGALAIVYRTVGQMHYFNCPFQVCCHHHHH